MGMNKEKKNMEENTSDKTWYAVLKDREDNDWGTGSYDKEEAYEKAKGMVAQFLGVIKSEECTDLIKVYTYSVQHCTREYSAKTHEFRHYEGLEEEERNEYVRELLKSEGDSDGTDEKKDGFDTVEEAKEKGEGIEHSIEQGFAMRYLKIDYWVIQKDHFDLDGDLEYSESYEIVE